MFIAVAVSIVLAFISLVVLVQGPKRQANVVLGVAIVLINSWLLGVAGLQGGLGASVEYARFVFVAGLLAIFSIVALLDAILRELDLYRYSFLHAVFLVIVLASAWLTASTQEVVGVITVHPGQVPTPVYGNGIIFYVIALAMALLLLFFLIVLGVRKTSGEERKRVTILSGFIVLSVSTGLMTNLILPAILEDTQLALLAPSTAAIMSIGLTYAIVRHGLFDVRLAAVRTLAYGLSVAVMAGIYFGLAYVASTTLFRGAATTGVSMSPVNIILALILAFIFQPIKQFFDKMTNRIFFRDRYDTDDFLGRLGEILTSTTNLSHLLKNAAEEIESTMKSSYVGFVVHREDDKDVIVSSRGAFHLSVVDQEHIMKLLASKEEPLLSIDELIDDASSHKTGHKMAVDILLDQHMSLLLDLGGIGYVVLGDQKGSGYTHRDARVLETVRDELIIAIQNARSVQEVREINTHLEQRIEKATRELRHSNDKLRKIDETKDEFVSMASHQLRTPLTSIKGYISMVLDGDAGDITEQQQKLLKEAYTSSERMVRLIGDFLNVSRLQTGKFVLERKPTDLVELVRGELDAITSMAATRNIQLSYKGPKQFPAMQLDEDKIRQVVMNFIDNAIYYSRPSSTIVVRLHKDEKFATLEVHDHGIGVPKEALDKLFTKFFRADNARRQRPDGTGVGLYLAKRVISGHGGELIVESTEGKGSVFGFRLPLQ